MVSDTPGEVCERHEARQEDGAKLRVVLNPAVERQGVKERIHGHHRFSATSAATLRLFSAMTAKHRHRSVCRRSSRARTLSGPMSKAAPHSMARLSKRE